MAKTYGLHYPPDDGEPAVIKGGLAERWAEKAFREISDDDVWAVVDEARRIGTPGLGTRNKGLSENRARHLRTALSQLFRWAKRNRLTNANPCSSVAAPATPKSRDRVLDADELRWFWKACEGIGPFEGALKILALTGQRLDEIAAMRRDEVRCHWDTWELYLPSERTKNKRAHVVPLTPTVLELIMREKVNGPFVFTTTGRSPISGWSKTKRRLDKAMLAQARAERGKAFKLKSWVIHDLRRGVATCLVADLGVRPDVVEQILNHFSGSRAGVAGIYNRAALLPERRAALTLWEQHVLKIVGPKGKI
jgi:integrase